MDLLVQGIDERKVRNIVVKELKEFKALRIAMENKKEIEDEGLEFLFPMLNNNEKEKIIKFKQINRAINEALDEIEREIIEKSILVQQELKTLNCT